MSRRSSIIAVVAVFLMGSLAFAQEAQKPSYFTVTTWEVTIPEDGSRSEFNQLMKEWSDKVVRQNDKIISERVVHHISGSNSRDVVIITEYANWADIEKAQEKQDELVAAAWPSENERRDFFRKFRKYFRSHSDEIYQENTDLRK
ncbi:MAG: hypothetical protein D6715_11570 [Calditrichaeota bacterium]|nr:MAG: hypothetical protein D6715_11570 [Calditrichota bacterium]